MLAEGGLRLADRNRTCGSHDFVELPSQIMGELGDREGVSRSLGRVHYLRPGEKMPSELIDRIVDAGNFQAAYMNGNVRQLSFAMFHMAPGTA